MLSAGITSISPMGALNFALRSLGHVLQAHAVLPLHWLEKNKKKHLTRARASTSVTPSRPTNIASLTKPTPGKIPPLVYCAWPAAACCSSPGHCRQHQWSGPNAEFSPSPEAPGHLG